MSRVLVPFDGSKNARDALTFACEKFDDDDIRVLFVVDTSVTYQPERVVGMKLGEVYEKREEEGEQHLEDAEELAAESDIAVTTSLTHGEPSRAILEQVDEHGIDHIVIGSHSQSVFERFFLGSVAERIVERAPASVSVIR
jgi:nucleotide-binding universal stress UspA family protein